MNIFGIAYININCADYERSLAFYLALGFRIEQEFPAAEFGRLIEGYQVGRHKLRAALLAVGEGDQTTRIDLIEWVEPKGGVDGGGRLADGGMRRMAFATSDFHADYERLRAMGVEFLSEPMMSDDGATPIFVCFKDPDGNILEIVPR